MSQPTTDPRMILTEMDAKEAAMNGAKVRYRRSPPYLLCPLCQGDGSDQRPYLMGCGPHEPGWEILPASTDSGQA
jgi:hypothetical protein